MDCERCGTSNPTGASWCAGCGESLTGQPQSPGAVYSGPIPGRPHEPGPSSYGDTQQVRVQPPARPPRPPMSRGLLVTLGVVLAVCAVAGVLVGWWVLRGDDEPQASPSGATTQTSPTGEPSTEASPTGQPTPQLPAGQKACPPVQAVADATVQHSAADDVTTSCAYAEQVRWVYVNREAEGQAVDLRVYDAASTAADKHDLVRCSGWAPVSCQGVDDPGIQVYLY